MTAHLTAVQRGVRRLAGAAILALVGSGLATSPAQADPISEKQAQARALSDRIDVLGRQDAALSEQYDRAALAMQSAQDQVQAAATKAAQASANASQAGSLLQADAVDAYIHGGNIADRTGRATNPSVAQTTVLRAEYATSLAANQLEHLDLSRAAATNARAAGAVLESARQQASRQAAQLASTRQATIASERHLQSTLNQIRGDLVTLVAQAEAAKQAAAVQAEQASLARQRAAEQAAQSRQLAAAQAAVQARNAPPPARSAPPIGPTAPQAPSTQAPTAPSGGGAGAVAVAAAMTRLGDPYVWAAAGPNAFDCSGLTMWAWAHAGVSLPHFSGAQYAATTHISMTALQPGDLVFAANPGEHVALYIGGGQVIAAPHSGALVRIEPLGPWFALASRP